MSFISKVDRREIFDFYKGLHEGKLFIQKIIFYYSLDCLSVFFDIEQDKKGRKPYKMVLFSDFEIVENKLVEPLQFEERFSPDELNFRWRSFLYKKIGKPYLEAYLKHEEMKNKS